MAIDKNTLTTDIWDTIYTYIQTTNAISTNNIFSAFNSTLISSKGYPLVILFPPSVSFNKLNLTGVAIESSVVLNIEIYNTSSQTVKSIKDEVVAKLLAGRKTFAGDGLKNMQIDGGSSDSWTEGKKKIHRITFSVNFRYIEMI